MYEYIDYVLSNYFGTIAEYSEEEAISILRGDITNNTELAKGLRTELQTALNDRSYSWKEALIEHDVLFIEDEEEARAYAKKILWDTLFASA